MRKQAEAKIAAQSDGKNLTKHRVEKLGKNDLVKRQSPELASESGETGRKNKYGNKKCMANGITFDSKKEMYRYLELKGLEDAGLTQISNCNITSRCQSHSAGRTGSLSERSST